MREGYSQAQNTRVQFVLQPDWLQHVSDEFQLNTQTHTLVVWRGDAPLDSNEIFYSTCSSRQKPGNFAHRASCPWPEKRHCSVLNLFLTSLFLFSPVPIFISSEVQPSGSHITARTRTWPHHFTTYLSSHRTTQLHLTHLKRAHCMLKHAYSFFFFSTNDHSPNSCRITGRQSASFTSWHTSGKPSVSPPRTHTPQHSPNVNNKVLPWPQWEF